MNPTGGMDVCCEYCVWSGRGLCDELITHPEESYRLWCVVVCDLETSWMRRPWPSGGGAVASETNKTLFYSQIVTTYGTQYRVAQLFDKRITENRICLGLLWRSIVSCPWITASAKLVTVLTYIVWNITYSVVTQICSLNWEVFIQYLTTNLNDVSSIQAYSLHTHTHTFISYSSDMEVK
jgi:hypothetical protein